jgi:sugar transferase (PEP-CTERM/EpsH1 system associated)
MKPHSRALVVHVVHRFSTGGLENGVVNLINRLPESRWQHAVVALTSVSQTFCERVKRRDVVYVELNKRPGHGFRLYPALWRLFRRHRPVIVHTRNLAALEASVPALLAAVPVRIHGEHGWDTSDLEGASKRYRLIRRLYSPFVGRYVTLSDHLHDYLSQKVGIDASRILRIYNGVDSDRFFPASSGRSPIAGCPFRADGLWLVGTVGRLQPVKNQVDLARAFVRSVHSSAWARERLRLVIVGEGPLRDDMERVLREGRVRELAWLPGERDDIPDIMRGLNCFVLPSLAEGISNTMLEAMASGLPVIATRVGGNGELVEDGLTGRLVPARDVDAMARAMLVYANDAPLARRHGKAGRNRVERLFSLDRMVATYDSLYREALAEHGVALATPGTA